MTGLLELGKNVAYIPKSKIREHGPTWVGVQSFWAVATRVAAFRLNTSEEAAKAGLPRMHTGSSLKTVSRHQILSLLSEQQVLDIVYDKDRISNWSKTGSIGQTLAEAKRIMGTDSESKKKLVKKAVKLAEKRKREAKW